MLTILFLAADPTDAARLRLDEELREIQEKIQLAKLRDHFTLLPRMAVRPTDISQALLDVVPNIVHFSGHGTNTGDLCLENRIGEIHPINSDTLARLFELFADKVNCVVLNSCYSEIQAKAIANHINYVIGMNQNISDKAAIAFAAGFYQALGAGRTIEDSFRLGCIQIELENIPEGLKPVLLKNDSVLKRSISSEENDFKTSLDIESRLVKPPAVVRPYNLSFEGPVIKGKPDGWFDSLGFVDFVSTDYGIIVMVRPDDGKGQCVMFHNTWLIDSFGSLMQRCYADHLAGKTIRLEAELRSRNIEKWSGLWLRADGNKRFNLFFDNMHDRPIKGNTPWTRYVIDAQLPAETAWINYGIVLSGSGALWADNFKIKVWSNLEKWEDL